MAAGTARRRVRKFVDRYESNDLLTYASAISFQIVSAIVPFLLFAFALLGLLHLQGAWTDHLGPTLKGGVSPTAFAFFDVAVRTALGTRQIFWITAGFLIALWEISGAVRAVMGALNTIYGDETKRSWKRRMLVSFGLGLAVGACWLLAIAVAVGGPLLTGDVGTLLAIVLFLVRWAVVAGLLLVAVALLLHYAPERHQPLRWVTRGSLAILGGTIVMSLGFGFYLRDLASYDSIYGSLSTVVVLVGYLYASAVIFLGGVQLDALARARR
jgi:membrane protein